ncbi:MAG: hypothetical protein ACI9T9_000588, partial [Oleiphilaceae bacterium]
FGYNTKKPYPKWVSAAASTGAETNSQSDLTSINKIYPISWSIP